MFTDTYKVENKIPYALVRTIMLGYMYKCFVEILVFV